MIDTKALAESSDKKINEANAPKLLEIVQNAITLGSEDLESRLKDVNDIHQNKEVPTFAYQQGLIESFAWEMVLREVGAILDDSTLNDVEKAQSIYTTAYKNTKAYLPPTTAAVGAENLANYISYETNEAWHSIFWSMIFALLK